MYTSYQPQSAWRKSTELQQKRMSSPAGFGDLNSQQALYQMQQNQLAVQLEALKLQNLEMQERILSAMNVSPQPQEPLLRRLPSFEFSHPQPQSHEEEDRRQRSAALANLQRASRDNRNRYPTEIAPLSKQNRLSFTGGEGLAERAMARKAAHVRSASSISSHGSPLLSETNPQMTSPSGPTLVLSSPGDDYPILARTKKNLVINTYGSAKEESDSSSSSPRTPDSGAQSFESNTTVASLEKHLNPAAVSFAPAGGPCLAAPFKPRIVSAPSILGLPRLIKPVRQPRGPCSDEDLPIKNFANRVRVRAINFLKSSNRSAPSSPTDVTHFPRAL